MKQLETTLLDDSNDQVRLEEAFNLGVKLAKKGSKTQKTPLTYSYPFENGNIKVDYFQFGDGYHQVNIMNGSTHRITYNGSKYESINSNAAQGLTKAGASLKEIIPHLRTEVSQLYKVLEFKPKSV